MRSTNTMNITVALAGATAGLFLAVLATASPAGAEPLGPGATPAPEPPGPAATTVQAAGTDGALVPPPDGVPHLASPDALPPGSTMDPSVMAGESPNVSYLKDLWHAVQNQEISGKEALLLGIAQRGMNTPYPDQAPGPNVPTAAGDPAPVPPPGPALPVPPPAVSPVPPTP
jgi:hypothetical protein